MPKKRDSHCFIPGCNTQYNNSKLSLFSAPKDLNLLEKWKKLIFRADKELNAQSAICELHFKDEFILRNFVHVVNEETVIIPRCKPMLKPDAIPTILPTKYFSKKKAAAKKRKSRECFSEKNVLVSKGVKNIRVKNTYSKVTEESSKKSGLTEIKGEASEPMSEMNEFTKTDTQTSVDGLTEIKGEASELMSEMNEFTKTDTQTSVDALTEDDDELMNVKLELYEAFTDISNLRKENEMLTEKLSTTEASQNTLQKAVSEKENELVTIKLKLQQAYKEVNALRTEKEQLLEKLKAEDIVQSILQHPNKLRFYTGLNSLKDFDYILSLISVVDGHFKIVSLKTQLLIVLIKLKLNLCMKDLGYRFRISGSTVGRICDFLIPLIEVKINLLVKCPINAALKKNIPVSFKNTVYENLYQRLVKYSKSKTKQPEDDEDDTDFEKLDENCVIG